MSKSTKQLTNLEPEIIKFQNSIKNKYKKENLTVKKGQIVFAGSSTMEIFPIEKMQKSLKLNKIIYNRGIRATTTEDVLNDMDTLIFDLEPEKVFINIGSNDVGYGISAERLLKNYDEILAKIKNHLPETSVYVIAYFPVNTVEDFGEEKEEHHSLFNTRNNENLQKANRSIQTLTKKYGYIFINLNDGLTDKNGNLKRELTFDGMHMLPNGYEIVLKNMMPYLEE